MATTYDPVWDVTIGGTGFLLANDEGRPYLRETTSARRERFDSARDPGENSLDSALWIRSQTSWHMGAGQDYAEPLETEPEVARFQFSKSFGVDVSSVPGEASVLGATSAVCGEFYSAAIFGSGDTQDSVVYSYQEIPSLNKYTKYVSWPGGTPVSLFSNQVNSITVSEVSNWTFFGTQGDNIVRFSTTPGSPTTIGTSSSPSYLHYSHERLWYVTTAGLWYVPKPETASALLSAPEIELQSITGITSSGKAIFVIAGGSVYAIAVNNDGTLAAPRRVVNLSFGERINYIHCHLDNWLVLSTSAGVRICDSTDPLNVKVGPLTIRSFDLSSTRFGAIAGQGEKVYVGANGIASTPTGSLDSWGIYRIDLSHPVTGSPEIATRYAYAADAYTTATFVSFTQAVVLAGVTNRYFMASAYYGPSYGNRAILMGTTTTKASNAWVQSGQINFSTAEKKAWLGIKVDAGGSGTIRIYATGPAGTEYEVTSGAVNTPVDAVYDINAADLPPSGWLKYRVVLTSGAKLYSIGVLATPLPQRTRYIRVPLQCFDSQLDRNNIAVGYEGFGYERLAALEALEESGALTTIVDNRTGESKRVVIDKILYEGMTAPDRSRSNFSGYVTVTLLTV